MRSRGFTLLEVMLAALIGTLVVGASIGVFNVLGGTDRFMGRRYQQSVELARLHLILQRSMRTLLINPESAQLPGAGRAGSAAAAALSDEEPEAPLRLLLELDASPTLPDLISRTPPSDDPAIPGITSPQRLEVVLSDPPIPANFIDSLDPTITQVAARPALRQWEQAQPEEETAPATGIQAVAVRGAFELRPDWATRRVPIGGGAEIEPFPPAADGAPQGWTLWWRPLPAEGTLADPSQDPRLIDPTRDVNAVPLISGLTHFRILSFKKRQRTETLTVSGWEDLPAYVEVELRTTTGITANWMFEIGWSSGPETVDQTPLGPDEEPAESGAAGAAGTGNRATDRPGAPGRRGPDARPAPGGNGPQRLGPRGPGQDGARPAGPQRGAPAQGVPR